MKQVDLSKDEQRRVVIAQGTEWVYQGHPTTVLMPDGKTIYAVWTTGHGGPCGPMAKSVDGGQTWEDVKGVPESWKTVTNCPSIYRLRDPSSGRYRLVVLASGNVPTGNALYRAVSEDEGGTWSEFEKLEIGPIVMPLCTIVEVPDGRLLGMTSTRRGGTPKTNVISQTWSRDGGMTWEPTRVVLDLEGKGVCEPCLVWSPDRRQLLALMRENSRKGPSMGMTSDDFGQSWSAPFELAWEVTGDRHMVEYDPDGRLVVAFRDRWPESPSRANYVAWVGRYDDLLKARAGEYRVKLVHHYGGGGDCGYSGVTRLPDGTYVAVTYAKYREGAERHSVVGVRFRLDELESWSKR